MDPLEAGEGAVAGGLGGEMKSGEVQEGAELARASAAVLKALNKVTALWTLDPEPWTLDPGPWTLDPGP